MKAAKRRLVGIDLGKKTWTMAFITAKEIEKAVAGCAIRVLSPHHLPIIYLMDKEDSLKLTYIAADRPDSRLPIVPIPSEEEMERRKLASSYRREQGSQNQEINRLQRTFSPTLFVHVGITTVVKSNLRFAGSGDGWEPEGSGAAVERA